MDLFTRIVNPNLLVRRINLTVNNVIDDEEAKTRNDQQGQLDLFADYEALQKKKELDDAALAKERQVQETILEIKKKFGSNALLKGLNFEEGSTAKERNRQMAHLKSIIKEHPIVSVTYFVADNRKQGGSYQNKEGRLKDIDETTRCLMFTDGTKIEMNRVIGLEQME